MRALDAHFGLPLRLRRIALGLSAADLARRVGYRPRDIEDLEEGKASVTASELAQLALELGVPAQLVADSSRIRSHLAWQPELADLNRIAAHALAWEARLAAGSASPS